MKNAKTRRDLPSWFDEFGAALTYSDHLVCSGNISDRYPSPNGSVDGFGLFQDVLWDLMRSAGLKGLLRYDPVTGLEIAKAVEEADRETLAAHFSQQRQQGSLSELAVIHSLVAGFADFRIGLVIDYASHLSDNANDSVEDFFVKIDLNSRSQRIDPIKGVNPTIWIVDQPADLPDWFVLNNASLREITIERPNLEDRFAFAWHLAERYGWLETMPEELQEKQLQQFALECDGKPLLVTVSKAGVQAQTLEPLAMESVPLEKEQETK